MSNVVEMGEALPERERKTPSPGSGNQHVDNNELNSLRSLSSSWYVAYTMPRHEKAIAAQLQVRGIESYVPLYRAIHSWKGRKAQVDLPLFPSYVFVRTPVTATVQVLEQPGVISMVGTRGKATPLPNEEIERLRTSLACCQAEPYPFLMAGRKVQIKSGPLAGLEGTILRRKGKARLVVSLETIQRSIIFELDASAAQLRDRRELQSVFVNHASQPAVQACV